MDEVFAIARRLVDSLVTSALARDRERRRPGRRRREEIPDQGSRFEGKAREARARGAGLEMLSYDPDV